MGPSIGPIRGAECVLGGLHGLAVIAGSSGSKEGKNGFCSENQQLKINKLIGYFFLNAVS